MKRVDCITCTRLTACVCMSETFNYGSALRSNPGLLVEIRMWAVL
jgi:hypothetical protein